MKMENIKTLIVDDWVLADGEVLEVEVVGSEIRIRTQRGIVEPSSQMQHKIGI